jgi:hypothetical protein
MVTRTTIAGDTWPTTTLARNRRSAVEVLRGKSSMPSNPEEWGRTFNLGRGEATRLVRTEISYRAKQRAKA